MMRLDVHDALAILGLLALGAGLYLWVGAGVALAVVGALLLRASAAPPDARTPTPMRRRPRWLRLTRGRALAGLAVVALLLLPSALTVAVLTVGRPVLGL